VSRYPISTPALLERLAAQGIEHEPIETYSVLSMRPVAGVGLRGRECERGARSITPAAREAVAPPLESHGRSGASQIYTSTEASDLLHPWTVCRQPCELRFRSAYGKHVARPRTPYAASDPGPSCIRPLEVPYDRAVLWASRASSPLWYLARALGRGASPPARGLRA